MPTPKPEPKRKSKPEPKPEPEPKSKPKPIERDHVQYHKDGTVWARGRLRNEVPTGYWEWFRVDGTRLRSGHFEEGRQVGEWITYDKTGATYKVTQLTAAIPTTGATQPPTKARQPRPAASRRSASSNRTAQAA